MANAKYNNTTVMADSGQLNWSNDRILAMLVTGATYNAAHLKVNETGALRYTVSEIPGRYIGTSGQAMGFPASFPRVAKDTSYQVLVVKDVGDDNPMLVAFYDTDEAAGPLRLTDNGMLILRPAQIPTAPTGLGMWLQI